MVSPEDQLTLNDEPIYPNEEGRFLKNVTLQEGINEFTFKAKKLLGKETVITTHIIYNKTSDTSTSSTINP